MQADRYSRMVARLKVALPLMALALLSTLFLISRAVDPTSSIPFADTEVQDRLTNQQVTGPYFSGMSSRGDQIVFVAETVTTNGGKTGSNQAKDVTVRVDMASGTHVTMQAKQALIDIARDKSELTGDVKITTSTGFFVRSEFLAIKMTGLDVAFPDDVFAITPVGDLDAGSMRLFETEDGKGTQLVFTNGVKLLYQPKEVDD